MLASFRKRAKDRDGATQTLELYYASDVHGSDQCWRKFLGAGRFYGVQALIMGGDLTGKAIVPIERARYWGTERNRRESRVCGFVPTGTCETAMSLFPAWMSVSRV